MLSNGTGLLVNTIFVNPKKKALMSLQFLPTVNRVTNCTFSRFYKCIVVILLLIADGVPLLKICLLLLQYRNIAVNSENEAETPVNIHLAVQLYIFALILNICHNLTFFQKAKSIELLAFSFSNFNPNDISTHN